MFCTKCGSQLTDEAKFCLNCGAPVATETAQAELPTAGEPLTAYEPAQTEAAVEAAVPEKTIELPKIQPPKFTEVSREELKGKMQQPVTSDPITEDSTMLVQPVVAAVNAPAAAPAAVPVATPAPAAHTAAQSMPVAKASSVKRNVIILIIVLVLLIAGAVTALFATGTIGGKPNATELLETAERYIDEQNYEQAIIEFDKILEIDPYNVDAYLGKAEALTALGREDEAREVLREAADIITDEDDLEEINAALAGAEETEEADTAQAETVQPVLPAESEEIPATAEPVETVETAETSEAAGETVFGDETALQTEEMLYEFFMGRGELDTTSLSEITELEFYNGLYVSVVMGDKGGTQRNIAGAGFSRMDRSGYNLIYNDGTTEYISMYEIGVITPDTEPIIDWDVLQSIDCVEYMPKLTKLVLVASALDDISPLESLTNLSEFRMYGNMGNYDPSVLDGLTQLKTVSLNYSYSSNANVNCTQIESLSCVGAAVSDISQFTDLKELTIETEDLSVLSGLTKLEKLDVSDTFKGIGIDSAIADAACLENMTELKELTISSFGGIDNISVLAGLDKLEKITFSSGIITDVQQLSLLTNVKIIDVSTCYTLDDDDIAELEALLPDCEIISKSN